MTTFTLDPYIIDSLMPDLVGHDHRPAAFIVYLALCRRADGQPSDPPSVRISHQSLALASGLSRSAVQSALSVLQRRALVTSKRATPTAVPQHFIHRPWARRSQRRS